MTATLSDYRSQAEGVGSDAYLGRLFWYSLSNVRLPHDQMIRMLHQCGILKDLPLPPTDVDVFKRVCATVKRTRIPYNSTEHFANFIQREFRDTEYVTRRIVREIVDHKGRRLTFTEMGDIRYKRSDASLLYEPIDSDIEAYEMWTEIAEGFKLWRGCMNLYGVREWVKRFIENLGATCVRQGGGVFFLAEEHVDRVESLEEFAALINTADCGQVEFHSLPLLDDGKQRDMVRRAFEAETCDAIDAMLVEVADLADKGLTTDRYARVLTDYQQLVARTQSYEALLEDTLANTGTRLQVFQKALLNLRLNVKE